MGGLTAVHQNAIMLLSGGGFVSLNCLFGYWVKVRYSDENTVFVFLKKC
jgi:hypothetical protein